ncbi:hypothetical protein D3C87_1837510 [compost metagenome]
MITVQIGVVALRMEASPAPISVWPKKISVWGRALLIKPRIRNERQCCFRIE